MRQTQTSKSCFDEYLYVIQNDFELIIFKTKKEGHKCIFFFNTKYFSAFSTFLNTNQMQNVLFN